MSYGKYSQFEVTGYDPICIPVKLYFCNTGISFIFECNATFSQNVLSSKLLSKCKIRVVRMLNTIIRRFLQDYNVIKRELHFTKSGRAARHCKMLI